MNELQQTKDALGAAITAAQELGQKVRGSDARGEDQEAFNKAMADVTALKVQCQNMEDIATLESDAAITNAAPEFIPSRIQEELAPVHHSDEYKEAHRFSWKQYLHTGTAPGASALKLRGVSPKVINALMESRDDLGGFTVPEDFRSEIIEAKAGFSVFRQAGARTIPTTRNAITMPAITPGSDPYPSDINVGDSNWKAEGVVTGGGAYPTQNKPTFGQERIPVHIWQPDAIELTEELIDDSAVPLESILASLIAKTQALDEDDAFINGNGVGKPQGVLEAGITSTAISAGSDITYALWTDFYVSLPAQYRMSASWIFPSSVLANLMLLTHNTGSSSPPVFPPNAEPGTIFGRPYFVSEFVPALDATTPTNNDCVMFGDFSYYVIAERQTLSIKRLVERFAPNVALLPTARIGGQLTENSAMVVGSNA